MNGHPVPWVFHADGRVESGTLWNGTWEEWDGGALVTMVHQGVRDQFLVKFNADGRSLVAYKNGAAFRNGVRQGRT